MNTRSLHTILRPTLVALVVAGLGLGSAPFAFAQDDDIASKVEELSQRGVELYSAGKYNEAIAVFEQAFRLAPVANLLYNIALSWEKLGKTENAVKSYERFIVADDADPNVRAKALARIKELRDELEQARNDARESDEDKLANEGTTNNKGNVEGGNNDTKTNKDPKDKDADGGSGGLAIAGYVTAGLGLASIGGGVVFGLSASSELDTFESTRVLADKESAKSSAESNALLADVLYGVGGAALVAGIVMIVLDSGGGESAPTETGSLQILPLFGPETTGAAISTHF